MLRISVGRWRCRMTPARPQIEPLAVRKRVLQCMREKHLPLRQLNQL